MMRKIRILAGLIFILSFFIGLSACVTGGSSNREASVSVKKEQSQGKRVYTGSGKSESFLQAINNAKMDAVRKAVIDIIGVDAEASNHEKLKESIYDSHNPNAFVFTDTFEVTRKDKSGNSYIVDCRVAVNIQAVRDTLRANGLLNGTKTPEKTVSGDGTDKGGAQTKKAEPVVSSGGMDNLTDEEKALVYEYIRGMTYMVYFNESGKSDPVYMKAAVSIANEYLAEHSIEAVDMEQIERLKRDEQKVYEEETGESISVIQWIAQKLNADIYIEIDGETSGEVSGDGYYGQANIVLKLYDPSTGRLLGSVPWNSPKTFSNASDKMARINAIQASVYRAMPIAIKQAENYMLKSLKNGIPYSVTVQNTPDSRVMSKFRRKLKKQVKDVKTLYQSAKETKYRVYFWGEIDDLIDIIFDVSETVSGLENMEQVMLRGNSVIFDTGL